MLSLLAVQCLYGRSGYESKRACIWARVDDVVSKSSELLVESVPVC